MAIPELLTKKPLPVAGFI